MSKNARRSTVAQHAHLPSSNPIKRGFGIALAMFSAVVLAAAGVAAFTVLSLTGSIRDNSVDIGSTPPVAAALEAYPGAFTMLVIGTDECDDSIKDFIGVERCSGPDAENHLNDVNVMVHVADNPRRVTVVSFPRDLRVERAECTDAQGNVTQGTDKINTAYHAGGENGLKCVADTVSNLTGIPIDFAAKLSFLDVIKITNAIGGVPVCVGGAGIDDPTTRLKLEPGPHVIEGEQALQFLRMRKGLVGESDLSRISNQQQYMANLIKKLRSDEVLTNPLALMKLAGVVANNIQADTNLADPVRMAQLALSIKDVPFSDITFVSYPVADANDGTTYVIETSAAANLLTALRENIPVELTRTGNGVVEENPAEGEQPGEPVEPDAPVDPDAPTPSPTSITLDDTAPGQTAAQDTCANGLGYGGG